MVSLLSPRKIDNTPILDEISVHKRTLGERLVILTHHYQRPEIVAMGDFRGDSFQLSEQASQQQRAEFIVFCGVHFMAESAAVLARADQKVFHPNLEAGCPMADMAAIGDLERGWRELAGVLGRPTDEVVLPLAYMNTAAEIKGFCGERGGAVCTSSNAARALQWGLSEREKVLFLPDEHLARNTAYALGIAPDEMALWDYQKPCGGLSADEIRKARVLLWKGYCHVHTWFRPEHVVQARQQHPGAIIVVHPECAHEVVTLADRVGSTSFIVRTVEEAPAGATIVIGTEINLTTRLAMEHPDKRVLSLSRSLCPNMYRINLLNLRRATEDLVATGGQNAPLVQVPPETVAGARQALERMLAMP